jgi:hypothetical protein
MVYGAWEGGLVEVIQNFISDLGENQRKGGTFETTKLTTRTSRRVSLDCQSLLRVSTQTAPVCSSTFGCQILVRKVALGGLLG